MNIKLLNMHDIPANKYHYYLCVLWVIKNKMKEIPQQSS